MKSGSRKWVLVAVAVAVLQTGSLGAIALWGLGYAEPEARVLAASVAAAWGAYSAIVAVAKGARALRGDLQEKRRAAAPFLLHILQAGVLFTVAVCGLGLGVWSWRLLIGAIALAWLLIPSVAGAFYLLQGAAVRERVSERPAAGWDPGVCLLVNAVQAGGDDLPSFFRDLGYGPEVVAVAHNVVVRYRAPTLAQQAAAVDAFRAAGGNVATPPGAR